MSRTVGPSSKDKSLRPVAGLDVDILSELTETSYIEFVRWTGLQARPDKRGKLSAAEEPRQTDSGKSLAIRGSGCSGSKALKAAITGPPDRQNP